MPELCSPNPLLHPMLFFQQSMQHLVVYSFGYLELKPDEEI
jgi:hypothetical protein